MTDLDLACGMLELLLEIYETKPALATQVGGGHYKDFAIQPAEYSQRNRLPYCESAVVKYVTRHRAKDGRQDIEKAIHCLQLLLEIEYPN